MRKYIISICCALTLIGLTACSVQRFEINPQQSIADMPSYEGTDHFVFWGLGQMETMHPGEACGPEGVNRVEVQEMFADGLLRILTLGIYSPRHYAVYCNNNIYLR